MSRRRRYDVGLAGLGIELAASVIGATLLGLWIDRHWQTDPWGLVICASLGFVGGMYNFIRTAQKAARESQRPAERASRGEDGEAGRGGAG